MEQQILAGLIARGVPEHIALGMVRRMNAESGLNPGINEVSPTVPGSRGGYGLNQWTGPRRLQYEKFAGERKKPFDDLDTQLDFTLWELNNSERGAWGAMQGAKSPEEAERLYVDKFLRPGTPHADMRGTKLTYGDIKPSGGILPYDTGTKEKKWAGLLSLMGENLMPQQAPPPQLMPRQVQAYTPTKRDTLTPYLEFFKSL